MADCSRIAVRRSRRRISTRARSVTSVLVESCDDPFENYKLQVQRRTHQLSNESYEDTTRQRRYTSIRDSREKKIPLNFRFHHG